ncbi:DNA-directed DNA polymerase alpha catalytic subunit pol1 [Clydaea vesicula]|uniref:DNA polymerase n=1 Tax=Clydaea vesicula TaxID=447962 RepID=A0AAD5U1U6_9FUNG|nr:DNA-directed DNA polymerase alpha catalytic subunit pol1 [Clydaea vesicula]
MQFRNHHCEKPKLVKKVPDKKYVGGYMFKTETQDQFKYRKVINVNKVEKFLKNDVNKKSQDSKQVIEVLPLAHSKNLKMEELTAKTITHTPRTHYRSEFRRWAYTPFVERVQPMPDFIGKKFETKTTNLEYFPKLNVKTKIYNKKNNLTFFQIEKNSSFYGNKNCNYFKKNLNQFYSVCTNGSDYVNFPVENSRMRPRAKKNVNNLSSLQKLKQAREGGSRLDQINDEAFEDVYDEVDEVEYVKAARRRHLEGDDFVADDDNSGYADYGQYEWDSKQYSSQEEDDAEIRKRKRKEKDGSLQALFSKQKNENLKKVKIQQESSIKNTITDDNLLNEIIQSIEEEKEETGEDAEQLALNQITGFQVPFELQQKKVSYISKVENLNNMHIKTEENVVEEELLTNNDEKETQEDTDDIRCDETPVEETEEKEVYIEEAETHNPNPEIKIKELKTKKIVGGKAFHPKFSIAKIKLEEDDPKDKCQNWESVRTKMEQQPSNLTNDSGSQNGNSSQSSNSDCLEESGSLRLFWIDAYEKNGIVYLFGKVFNKNEQKFVSCCVTINNMLRNIFVLPRSNKVDINGLETDETCTFEDVFDEFEMVLSKYKINDAGMKPCKRGYAFDDIPDIPAESTYLKVVYKFDQPPLPMDLSGTTFSHCFGTNTGALELLIKKRKLMGPQWIEITEPLVNGNNISWAKFECSVNSAKNIKISEDLRNLPIPPLNILSLNIKTLLDPVKKLNEIVAINVTLYENAATDGNANNISQKITILRQWKNIPIPNSFSEFSKTNAINGYGKLEMFGNERHLLNYFIATLHRMDPDVLVGHNIIGFTLDVLLHRMKFNKIDLQWSKLGRLRRKQFPKLQPGAGGMGESSLQERSICSGRLLCDTYLMSKDLVKSKNYSLGELAYSQLNFNKFDMDAKQIEDCFWKLEGLKSLIGVCECDSWLSVSLMFKLQMLPLTMQLTKLAGNLWARTLTGARAERNEYLLLHEFHDKKFIVPDKNYGGDKKFKDSHLKEQELLEEDNQKKTSRKKPAYAGDFNSLYPSIIQEYNICFTTVQRCDKESLDDQIPDVPDPSLEQGILPKLIAALVNRRKQVKSLMKDPKISDADRAMYDIRQKALKLTANSMYGCLGFTNSRFYAKQLAALVTSKGREILQATVNMATDQNLDVIYGDTDSIMIFTNTDDFLAVKKIGNEFKSVVNKKYKLLEIEIDGMYQRMLLLKKKKYAALVVEENKGNNTFTTKLETKGLEEVRRDWCEVSKESSKEEVIENIHQYLTDLALNVREGNCRIDKFVIYKSLSKLPNEYADKKSQPHVQVALRMKASGINVKVGETIPYIVCVAEDGTTSDLIASRARHPEELQRKDTTLKIDYEWYLSNQIHPPVVRLCEPIEETDSRRIADCLGLDLSKYKISGLNSSNENGQDYNEKLYTLASQMTEEERFKDCVKFEPKCRFCKEKQIFNGLFNVTVNMHKIFQSFNLFFKGTNVKIAWECNKCEKIMPIGSIQAQLICLIKKEIGNFSECWLVCDDTSCGCRTRQISIKARKCPVRGCRGFLTFEYGSKLLLTQFQYFLSLLDDKKILSRNTEDSNDDILELLKFYESELEKLRSVVDSYLNKNSCRTVDLTKLFGFMKLK